MDRRSFLIATAGAPVLGANDRVNVAVVGVRGRGRDHISIFGSRQRARVVAICDIDDAQSERAVALAEKVQGSKPRVYRDFRKLLEDREVDVVSLATPNHWHALQTIWACQAGKDVYVEKPASHNVWEGRKMVEAARKYGRIVQ
ncbi:MAG: Gfo/Idh/MocA family oxidoreductase, partial [Bryobacterales bacterium]|nr:Gfo/Idh/MocA family oxidoreductase [Bryobacteraceae bacterium]MDW8132017.1 Gfo/Idh/MocA family oxidoreductase [Bryobacterales bacterium]